jgi:hypothetical protein
MKRAALLALALAACGSPEAEPGNPRAKTGDAAAAPAWTAIASSEGAAIVYARPGAAPDLMLWRKAGADGVMMRVHVFRADAAPVALSIETPSGHFDARDPKIQAGLQGSGRVMLEGRFNDQAVEAMTAPEGFTTVWATQSFRVAALPGDQALKLIRPLPEPGIPASAGGQGPSRSSPAPAPAPPAR